MSNERDPLLDTLFAEATRSQPLAAVDTTFIDNVMAGIETRRRNVLFGRIAIVAVIVMFELLLSAPLQNSVGTLTSALGTSLVELNDSWIATLLEPINSVAGVIGVLLLGLHALYRRVIH